MKYLIVFVLMFSLFQVGWIFATDYWQKKISLRLFERFRKLEPTDSYKEIDFRKKLEASLNSTLNVIFFLVRFGPLVPAAIFYVHLLRINSIPVLEELAYLPALGSVIIMSATYIVITHIDLSAKEYKVRKIYFDSVLKRAREIYPELDEDEETKKKVLTMIEQADFETLGIGWYTEDPEERWTRLDMRIEDLLDKKQTELQSAETAENPS